MDPNPNPSRSAGVVNRPPMSSVGPSVRNPPAPHEMKEELTPVADTFATVHLGVPRIDSQEWQLDIDGLVEKPARLNLADLRSLPSVHFESVHQCAGNPLEPTIPKRRVCNVIWTGVRLADLLHASQPRPEAQFVWAEGADYGTFFGWTPARSGVVEIKARAIDALGATQPDTGRRNAVHSVDVTIA